MKKWIALLLALVMVSLCGCEVLDMSENETTAPPRLETTAPMETAAPDLQIVELSAWVVSEGIWADTAEIDALLVEFNAYYPNIIVNVEYKTADALGSGKPDIVLADAEQIKVWNAQGGMADLSDLWGNGLGGDVYEDVEAVCANGDNGYHTVPMCVIPYCMAVNKAVFEEAEALQYLNTVNHTWNTASFLKAVQAVYDTGTDTVGTIFCKDTQEDVFSRLLVSNLYDGSFVERKTGTYTVTSDAMSKALAALAEQDGIRFDSGVDAEAARAQFLSGETAFVLNWNAALQVKNAHNSNIFFMNYPSGDSVPETCADVHGFGIFDNGDPVKLAASKTFVMHMSANAAAIQATKNLPARESAKDVYDGTALEQTMKELSKLLSYLTEKEATAEHWENARTEWNAMLRGIGSGGEEWQAAVEACQRDLNSLFPELFPPETEAPEETEPTE